MKKENIGLSKFKDKDCLKGIKNSDSPDSNEKTPERVNVLSNVMKENS